MSSKGVTPVVATVLLITISIAATGAAYTFIIGAQDEAKSNFRDRLSDQQREEETDLNIEHMYKGSGGNALLVVRNTGNRPQFIEDEDGVKYWNLYVDGKPVGDTGTDWQYLSGRPAPSGEPVTLGPDDTLTIDSTKGFPASNTQQEFKLVGRYGSQDTYVCFPQQNSC